MGIISVTNNTDFPIDFATSWNGIVQEYHNALAAGKSASIKGSDFGWQDFAVAMSSPGGGFNHDKDWVGAVGTAATVGGAVLTVATAGGATPLLLAAGGAVTVGGVVASVADQVLSPAQLKGMWGPDGYEINVDGGTATFNKDDPPKIASISEMRVFWKNKVSEKRGNVSAGDTAPAG